MSVRYNEESRTMMIIGAVITQPTLLETAEAKRLSDFDFPNPLHRLVYFAVHNLYQEGHTKINGPVIDQYLSSRPKMHKYFLDNDGYEFVNEAVSKGLPTSFKPNVERVKKLSLLRGLNQMGVDTNFIYDDRTSDLSLRQKQSDALDQKTVEEIGSEISDRIDKLIDESAGGGTVSKTIQAGEGLRSLLERLKEEPEVGSPLFGGLINTMTRGARFGKFYLRSAPTGGGKSRMLAADMVNFAVDKIYYRDRKQWVENGVKENALFITTELDEEETQTIMLSFLCDIDEEKILDGNYTDEEAKRLIEGVEIIEKAPLWIEHIPDFSILEIERIIRRHVRENKVNYVAFDYIHISMKLLAEISQVTNGMKLREDQILFMLSSKLKDLANELGIFIESATQLNGAWEDAEEINQNLLRGSKAIADRIDVGLIGMKTRAVDEEIIANFVAAGYPEPNYVLHFYKIRRGKYAGTKLWCRADLSTSRITGLFVTGHDNQPIPVKGMDVKVVKSVQKKEKQLKREASPGTKDLFGKESAF